MLCWTLEAHCYCSKEVMSHVPFANLVSIQCVHGDVKQYPKLKLMCVQYQTYLLNVAIVDDLPADMNLGRDLPVLTELLPLQDLHHCLLQGGTNCPRKTCCRRLEKGLGTPAPGIQTEGLDCMAARSQKTF